MRINYNTSAVISNKALNQNDDLLSRSLQRLSSGLKINEAKDNPAGLAIANRMDSQVRGLKQAGMSTKDGISVVQTADGALSEVASILQRLNQLAIQAGTDTTTDADREIIDKEAQQLQQEIERIAKDTEFNGQPLLDGTWDLKGYSDEKSIKVEYYTGDVPTGKYQVDISAALATDPVDASSLKKDNRPIPNLTAELSASGDMITYRGMGDFELKVSFDPANPKDATLDITGIGAMKVQTGVNEGQELAIQIQTVSLKNMGMEGLRLSSFDDAQKAINQVKEGIDYINDVRAKLGAYQNRLEHNSDSVDVSNENLTASYSQIVDVDMAEEMTEYTTRQVLVQAGVSMLSQANERPQQVLQLLQ